MRVLMHKSQARGSLEAPPSKSYTIRCLMCAALSCDESRIINPLVCDDTLAAAAALRQVGVQIVSDNDFWTVRGGELHAPAGEIDCADSAATLRFMAALCALLPGESRLIARASLARRPQLPLIQALQQLGIDCSWQENLPGISIKGGKLKSSSVSLPGDISSQFISALLLIAPLSETGLKIRLNSTPKSKSYISMTLQCQQQFGIKIHASADLLEYRVKPQSYRSTNLAVEADWSSASYLLALGAATGKVEVTNLNLSSLQGDSMILEFLKQMQASLQINGEAVTVEACGLSAIEADLADCIDLLPTMAALAALAQGKSAFHGIQNARLKESNRVAAMKQGLESMGIPVKEEQSRLVVEGITPHGAVIDTYNDHRIAMAFSILGAACGRTIINGAECVSKTFPQFWDNLKNLGLRMATSVK